MFGAEKETVARNEILAKLEPKDRQLFQKLEDCCECSDKPQKLQLLLALFASDKTQTILKLLAFRADSQTAFNLILWSINGKLVELDWLYDVAYKISTEQSRQDIRIENIYQGSYRLKPDDLATITVKTQPLLQSLRLEDFDPRGLVNSLEQAFLISLLTSFLSFQKIGSVDLDNIAVIAKSFAPPVDESSQDAASKLAADALAQSATAPGVSVSEPSNENPEAGYRPADDSLEDVLVAFNLQYGGNDEQILRRTLDNFLFMRVVDRATGTEQIVYKPSTQALQYCLDGGNEQLVPLPVGSTQAWPSGVYLLQRGQSSVKVMRLPGDDFFEIFPEGPDPYLRVMTINSTLNNDSTVNDLAVGETRAVGGTSD
jgi:hypothetical protein